MVLSIWRDGNVLIATSGDYFVFVVQFFAGL